jgi:hypothetical protein
VEGKKAGEQLFYSEFGAVLKKNLFSDNSKFKLTNELRFGS